MKIRILFLTTLILFGCKEKNNISYFTPEKASWYFHEIEEICDRDSGRLWAKNIYGPLMYVDRTNRRIFANRPDSNGILKERDGVFTGLFPRELIINNSPVKFGGTLFAMVPIPPEEDSYRIKTRSIHSLFHRFQELEGIFPSGFYQNNMDDKEARLWIKLEWKALRKAIERDGEERQLAIRDALIFRGSNREFYRKYAEDENRFETYEGLATFTYTLFCTNSPEEFKSRLFENLDRVYSMQSYARSYGSVDGALYAYLLYLKGFNFQDIKTDSLDLGKTIKEVYKINLPAVCRDVAGSLALNYNIDVINKEEEKRLSDIQERLHKLTSKFIEKPVVFFELESPYFDFEPENVQPLDTLGTLYSSMRVSDNWGKLTVDGGGCLVSNNFKYFRITAKGFSADKNHISGEGWHLILNSDWEVIPVNQNYLVRKLMP